jgi:hypothetical protein
MRENIRPEDIISLAVSPAGLFKGAGEHTKKILLLNKADTPELRRAARNIVSGMVGCQNRVTCCIVASLETGAVHEVFGC